MTFSIAGRCAQTGMLGVAITTSSICVGARCPWVRAGVGAVATQNITLPSIGPDVLDTIADGKTAQEALDIVMARPLYADYRQVTVIDNKGRTAHFSGDKTLGTHRAVPGENCIAAGNLLKSEDLPATMVASFEAEPERHIAERLLKALEEGLYTAGGEQGPVHSASLLVADRYNWPLVDLRVDWNEEDPIAELRKLWDSYKPEMADYITRAIDPASAPAYGVPGDP
ncbi:DUF1028 domain-containing protein [Methyloligella sp. 2.7D]|uniref:DUF1028 domain-containing protein n=1 Tax=unclassified Methyloligella TaxID=2625955 RepID=UPI00157D8E8F|nr:DUF1028 domain-containing protein [Methyloligella sp. GL2]QKP76669.1 DUF1028 domain-containing protein [Methyloligella sp. GL2]